MFNIFFLCFAAIGFALFLAVFITRSRVPNEAPRVPPEDDLASDPKERGPLGLKDLEKVAARLCKENGLTIKDRMENNPTEVYWIAESKNEFFFGTYVLCLFLVTESHPFALMADVLEFKDFIKSLGSTKGFFFTNGYFTRDVHQPLEGPKVALYNRLKVLQELDRPGL